MQEAAAELKRQPQGQLRWMEAAAEVEQQWAAGSELQVEQQWSAGGGQQSRRAVVKGSRGAEELWEGQQSKRAAVKGSRAEELQWRATTEQSKSGAAVKGSRAVVKGSRTEELQWRATTEQSCRWSSNIP
jgi:hypothetical protein